MVDRIRYPTVSYLPFYYVFFQFLLLTIFSFTSQNIDDKGHTLKPGSDAHEPHSKRKQTREEVLVRNSIQASEIGLPITNTIAKRDMVGPQKIALIDLVK